MYAMFKKQKNELAGSPQSRSGNILVLAALFLSVIFAFAAFSIDLSYISLTKTQLQSASDGSALAAGIEMSDGFGMYPSTASSVKALGLSAAQTVAAQHKNGDVASTYMDTARDVRFGTLTWNGVSANWKENWGATPYNIVEVTLRRTVSENANDSALPMLFGPVIGKSSQTIAVTASAALLPAGGFRVGPGEFAPVLPFAMDESSWEDLMAGTGGYDDHSYDPDTGSVSKPGDGINEIDLYPGDDTSLPSGNRGTVDFGSASNSTADIERQILQGLNETDMSYFPDNELTLDSGPIELNGDTGMSAGFKDELASIVGQTRILPLFSTVTNPGNNATYTLVRWVGVRIMDVKLTGKTKHVSVQPASFIAPTTIRVENGGAQSEIRDDTVFAPLFLYE